MRLDHLDADVVVVYQRMDDVKLHLLLHIVDVNKKENLNKQLISVSIWIMMTCFVVHFIPLVLLHLKFFGLDKV